VTAFFVSDLHLDAERPEITQRFFRFLEHEAAAATDLYILGDLFEVWIGDDAGGALGDAVAAQLARLAGAGTRVRLMHGNRDFLLGTDFAARAGATLLEDPCVARLHDERVLLSHGDQLCTDDHDYLAFRREVRDRTWQARFLAAAVPYREAFARNARDASRASKAGKTAAIMDVNANAVLAAMLAADTRWLVHGHTHRPGLHEHQHAGTTYHRVVLGDWDGNPVIARWTHDGVELQSPGP
jgi:UDP-2,3-diacylglucosamine hydrolase